MPEIAVGGRIIFGVWHRLDRSERSESGMGKTAIPGLFTRPDFFQRYPVSGAGRGMLTSSPA